MAPWCVSVGHMASESSVLPANFHRALSRSCPQDVAARAKGPVRHRRRLPCSDDAAEVFPHQPEVVLSVLHVQSGGIFRSAMTCGRSLCRLERHRTFHRTLFLPPLADACQSAEPTQRSRPGSPREAHARSGRRLRCQNFPEGVLMSYLRLCSYQFAISSNSHRIFISAQQRLLSSAATSLAPRQAMLLGRAAIARARGAMVRHCGTSLRVPKAPAGTGDVFHAQMMLPKYSLTNQKWFFLFFMCNLGAYSGAR
eukprot:symbB.v1.2.026344.t1/scaffold2624.1/size74584/6